MNKAEGKNTPCLRKYIRTWIKEAQPSVTGSTVFSMEKLITPQLFQVNKTSKKPVTSIFFLKTSLFEKLSCFFPIHSNPTLSGALKQAGRTFFQAYLNKI